MKKIFMIFGLALAAGAVHAQSGAVRGRILQHDGTPAAQVLVTVDDAEEEVTTDNNGVFVLDVTPGRHKVTVHGVGIKAKTVEVTVGDDKTVSIDDIYLKKGGNELEEIVIGDTKNKYVDNKPSTSMRVNTPILEMAQNIQVVPAKVMADQQATSMSDGVIRNVSGATRLEHWGDMYSRVNARGGRLASFRNGENITSNWGPLTEDMAFVDRIEFIKGPAGFMMSTGEPSGIFNVVTKRPTGETKGQADFMFGSYDFYRATVDLDGKFDKAGKVLYRLNVLGQTKNSFRPYEFNDRYGFAPVITYNIDDKTSITAEYIFQHAKMSNVGSSYIFDTAGYGTLPRTATNADPGLEPTNVNDHNINFVLNHKFSDTWKLTAQASYYNSGQVGSSMWTSSSATDSLGNPVNPVLGGGKVIRNQSIWDSRNIMKFGQVYLNGEATTGFVRHRVVGGLDISNKQYMADWSKNHDLDTYADPYDPLNPKVPSNGYGNVIFQEWRDSVPFVQRASSAINQTYASLYAQDELGFLEGTLRLTLAGRYTYVKNNNYGTIAEDKKFTPRIGLSYSIDRNTAAYALYDQTFVPQVGEKKDGSEVKPLTGNNMEIGVKRNWFNGKWATGISVYRILKNNELAADPSDGTGRYVVDFGQTKTQGVEVDLRGEIVRGLTMVANYAYTDSKISKSPDEEKIGNVVPGYAKHTANAWINYAFQEGILKGFGISGGFTYLVDRTTWSWDASTAVKQLPDYFKLDGGLFYETGKIKLTANLFNLTDKYLYSGSAYANYYYYQAEAGRNWKVGVTYRF